MSFKSLSRSVPYKQEEMSYWKTIKDITLLTKSRVRTVVQNLNVLESDNKNSRP